MAWILAPRGIPVLTMKLLNQIIITPAIASLSLLSDLIASSLRRECSLKQESKL
jgi:hypothetical protein